MHKLQVFHDIRLFQCTNYGSCFVIDLYAHRLKACGKSVIFVKEAIERAALCHLQRIKALAFPFFYCTVRAVQILHCLDGIQIDIIFLYILVIKIPELGNGGILVGRNRIYISADFYAVPQLFRNKAVQIRSAGLHHIRYVLKCAQVYKLAVIGIVGKHHIEIFTGVNDSIHLLIVIAPACHLDINFHAQLFHQIFIDICQTIIVIAGSGSAYRPPNQCGDISAGFVSCAAVCRRFCRCAFCCGSTSCFSCRCACTAVFGTASCQHTHTEYTGKSNSQKSFNCVLFHSNLLIIFYILRQ